MRQLRLVEHATRVVVLTPRASKATNASPNGVGGANPPGETNPPREGDEETKKKKARTTFGCSCGCKTVKQPSRLAANSSGCYIHRSPSRFTDQLLSVPNCHIPFPVQSIGSGEMLQRCVCMVAAPQTEQLD
uniref:Uncharacterized protein n=1 Tax=Setaria viridis TaxID=4556 RepID=A0A4U6T8N9_SETVI|nr:hypothetical protein SEVIR_9G441200v2 [Setaria viridis]